MSAKTKRVKRLQYDRQQLFAAVEAVRNGMKNSAAARNYGVPPSTLNDQIKGKVREGARAGINPMLSVEEEIELADYITYMARMNMPLRRCDIKKTIVDMIRRSGSSRVLNCLINLSKGPSDKWFRKFHRRHPEVESAYVAAKSALCERRNTESNEKPKDYFIDQFFNIYESVLNELDLTDKPQQIFNCEETWINDVVHTGQEQSDSTGNMMNGFTVMMAVSAAGRVLPPMLIYKSCFTSLTDDTPTSSDSAPSNSAAPQKRYMDKELFLSWFRDIFIPNCGTQRPVLLVLDNSHDTNISMDVFNLAKQNQIEMLAFSSHTTRTLQPLNVGIFGPLKKKYKELCGKAKLKHSDFEERKTSFAGLWQSCIQQAATPEVVQRAFSRSGLYPCDPCAVGGKKRKHISVVADHKVEVEAPSLRKMKLSRINETNAAFGAIVPKWPQCEECGRYNHSGHIPDSQQSESVTDAITAEEVTTTKVKKKRRRLLEEEEVKQSKAQKMEVGVVLKTETGT